jgi:hypothetical protein
VPKDDKEEPLRTICCNLIVQKMLWIEMPAYKGVPRREKCKGTDTVTSNAVKGA